MSPLIAIAASVLPEILRSVVGAKASPVAETVAAAVRDAAGTSDAADAQKRLQADPAAAERLKIRLAEIAAEEGERRETARLDAQKLEIEAAAARNTAKIEALRVRLDAEDRRRAADSEDMRARLADKGRARAALADLARLGSPLAWGAPAVSVIVATGFFTILVLLIALPDLPALTSNSPVFQIINIAVGALAAAFATVVSFWLGSSQGSRAKDAARAEIEARQADAPAPWPVPPAGPADAAETPRRRGSAASRAGRREASKFGDCVDIVLAHEGGYIDHPGDPGGATNLGITLAALRAWRGIPVMREDVRSLTPEEAREIYRANYWNALNCDALPEGIDLVVFDFGVNAGPARSARLLQRTVGVHGDGVIGPITVGATESLDAAEVIRRFSEARLDYYRGLRTWRTFGRGWSRRTRAVERAALKMAR